MPKDEDREIRPGQRKSEEDRPLAKKHRDQLDKRRKQDRAD